MSDLREQLESTLGTTYALERELAGGGMSRVFVAEERALRRQVVIKILPFEMAAGVSIERFKREIALAARLQHPHIVPVLSAGESGGLPFLTMPFVSGESLRARLDRGGELPVADGVRLLREVASALAHAHEQGIIHRDIKPDNILLSHGSAMVTDFGVAKALSDAGPAGGAGVTATGVALGTPAYMSPEQASASPNVDGRADIYAFGVVAYELFAGQPPFAGRSAQALFAAHVTEVPESVSKLRPSLPPALAALIMRCLEKRAADRPQRADEVMNALDAVAAGLTPAVVSRAPATRTRKLGFAVGAAALLVVAAWFGWRRLHAVAVPGDAASLVVLPAEVFGPADQQYLADAVSATLSSHLAEIAGLETKVPPTRLEWDAIKHDPQKIVRAYSVALYVAPHVYVSGGRLSMTFQLVRGATRTMLWSHTYDGTPDTYLAQIRQTANDLREVIRPAAQVVASPVGSTKSSEAELAFQEGLHFANRYNNLHESGDFDVALASLNRAFELDPFMADAVGEIGILHIFKFEWHQEDAERVAAQEWGNRAVGMDPRCGIGLVVLAMNEWLQPKADQNAMLVYALRGARFAPRNPLAPNVLGIALAPIAALQVEGSREALRLDPLLRPATNNLALTLFVLNRSAEALAAIDAHVARDPGPAQTFEALRARLLLDLGRGDTAAAIIHRMQPAPPPNRGQRWGLIEVGLQAKDPTAHDSASAMVSELAASKLTGQLALQAAKSHVPLLGRFGQTDAAVRLLLLSIAHDAVPAYDWLANDDRLTAVRSDPRMAPILVGAKAQLLATLKVLDAAVAQNELPAYLEQPLKDLHARMGF